VVFKYYFGSILVVVKEMAVVKFKRKIRQSGGSASIVIPQEILVALKWKIGDTIDLYTGQQEMIVRKELKL
jgi:bifunctional DNA-binding transcriptional regulator/antitoxin component of YhaV-PrlF toxin-antitoxin module